MARIKDLTAMCKAGNIEQAFDIALADYDCAPNNVWTQREVGWVLYYMIRVDVGRDDFSSLTGHLEVLKSLTLLCTADDHLLFDSILYKLGDYVSHHLPTDEQDTNDKLDNLYVWLLYYDFSPSMGYSYLLRSFIKHETWPALVAYLEWWNFDKLRPEDYIPYTMPDGKQMMTLAEQVHIAGTKALLLLDDLERSERFLPRLTVLIENHPEMHWPGYCYTRLLVQLGADGKKVLESILPFARSKANEFWVWQLMAEICSDNPQKHLACLLRAVNCRTKECFLGKIRRQLAQAYIRIGRYDCAKFHIDRFVKCYMSQGWHLPGEVMEWCHQSWMSTTTVCDQPLVDFMAITNTILREGAEECVAVVTYVDKQSHKASMVVGHKRKLSLPLRLKVWPGCVLRLYFTQTKEGHVRLIDCRQTELPSNLDYVCQVEGNVRRRKGQAFAFLDDGRRQSFIPPALVERMHLEHGVMAHALIVYDYNRKKEVWNWVCVMLEKLH